jgi:hypothetical protein
MRKHSRRSSHLPSPHTQPEHTPAAVAAHPLRNTQPFLNHETLTQDQQAKFLGVEQETVMNLGHPCGVSDLMRHPLGTQRDDYTSGKAAERAIHESPNVGLSTDHAALKGWQDYASKNSYGSKGHK